MSKRQFADDFPRDVDLVLTAAHCITDMGSSPHITATTLTGQVAQGVRWVLREPDVAFVLISPRMGPLVTIRAYGSTAPVRLPVLALIRVGGGRPTITQGFVLETEGFNVG